MFHSTLTIVSHLVLKNLLLLLIRALGFVTYAGRSHTAVLFLFLFFFFIRDSLAFLVEFFFCEDKHNLEGKEYIYIYEDR